jgi:hypothetical protein
MKSGSAPPSHDDFVAIDRIGDAVAAAPGKAGSGGEGFKSYNLRFVTMAFDDPALVRAQYETEEKLRARKSVYADTDGDDPRELAFEAVAEIEPKDGS